MDSLFASLSPSALTRFNEIPVVCVSEVNQREPEWELFFYGAWGAVMVAATPVHDAGIRKFLSDDPQHNLGLVASLAKHGNPSQFMVNVATGGCQRSSGDANKLDSVMRRIADSVLPYQVEFAQSYEFDSSKCGTFGKQDPCWLRLESNNKFEPDMVVVAPGSVPGWWCDAVPKNGKKMWRRLMNMRVGDLIPQGKAWHPDQICPDYRLVCGARTPPNLPELASNYCDTGAPHGTWMQIPRNASNACGPNSEDDPDCVGLKTLQSGALPGWDEPSMRWIQVDNADGELCKASNLVDAGKIAAQLPTSHLNNCILRDALYHRAASSFEWSDVGEPGSRTARRQDSSVKPSSDWILIKDESGNFDFVPRVSGSPHSSTHTREIIAPLSKTNTFGSRMREWRKKHSLDG